MATKQIAKEKNVLQILKAEQGLSDSSIKTYYERINAIAKATYTTKKYDFAHPVPVSTANKIFKDVKAVEKLMNGMFPTNSDDVEQNRKNVENQKAYYTAIRTLTRSGKLQDVTETIQQEYVKLMTEQRDVSQTTRGEARPKQAMLEHPEIDWVEILRRRDAYFNNRTKTIDRIRRFVAVGFYTYMNPRRLEYRLLKVYFKNSPKETKGINYLVVKPEGIEMSLDVFKNRIKRGKDILPTYNAHLPPALVEYVKLYIKKAGIKHGDYLFTKEKGANAGQFYGDSPFSMFIATSTLQVLGAKLNVDDLRTYRVNESAYNYMKYTPNQLQELAISMGDMSVLTNQSYRKIVEEQQESGNDTPQGGVEEAQEEAQEQTPEIETEQEPQVESPTPVVSVSNNRDVGAILDGLYTAARPFLIQLFSQN